MERKMLLDSDVCDLETKKSYVPGSEAVDLSELARSEIKRSGVSLSQSRQSIQFKNKKGKNLEETQSELMDFNTGLTSP